MSQPNRPVDQRSYGSQEFVRNAAVIVHLIMGCRRPAAGKDKPCTGVG